jgi:hypothetical protein
MEAEFDIDQRFSVSGRIYDGPKIVMDNGDSFLAKLFEARVSPGRGFGNTRVLRIDRFITVTGPRLKADDTPTWDVKGGRKHYWLSEESTPVWVREIALDIENTYVPTIVTPNRRTLTEPK